MSGRRSPVVRFFYVALACAVLWLSNGAAAATPRLTDTIVLVGSGSGSPSRDATSASSPASSVGTSSTRSHHEAAAAPGTPPTREPAGTTKNIVLIRYRYLRHCTILC